MNVASGKAAACWNCRFRKGRCFIDNTVDLRRCVPCLRHGQRCAFSAVDKKTSSVSRTACDTCKKAHIACEQEAVGLPCVLCQLTQAVCTLGGTVMTPANSPPPPSVPDSNEEMVRRRNAYFARVLN